MLTTIHVARMHAVHAARAVTTALAGVEGITAVKVRLGVVEVAHDGRATADALRDAVAAAGFEAVQVTEDARHLHMAPPHGGA